MGYLNPSVTRLSYIDNSNRGEQMKNINKSVQVLSKVIDILLGADCETGAEKTINAFIQKGYYL